MGPRHSQKPNMIVSRAPVGGEAGGSTQCSSLVEDGGYQLMHHPHRDEDNLTANGQQQAARGNSTNRPSNSNTDPSSGTAAQPPAQWPTAPIMIARDKPSPAESVYWGVGFFVWGRRRAVLGGG